MAEMKEQSKGNFQNFAGKSKDSPKEESSTLQTAASAVTDAAKSIGSTISDMAGKAKHKAEEFASATGDVLTDGTAKAGEWISATTVKTEDVGKHLTELVRTHPIPIVLAGVGLGFFLGKMTASRR